MPSQHTSPPPCAYTPIGRRSRDHPRVCGEHSASLASSVRSMGSSPRVRGTLSDPRWCGTSSKEVTGSSPRVRGTQVRVGSSHERRRIIPACAGNTGCSTTRRRSRQDHPRVCGEHWWYLLSMYPSAGSSPRVRGTLGLPKEQLAFVGIIPACAGNTTSAPSARTAG